MTPLLLFLGLVTTELPPSYELHETVGNALITPWPQTEAECIQRAQASVGKWTCVTRRRFETVGVCSDVPQPPAPPQTDLWAEQDPNDDTLWRNYVPGWVPAEYPQCWVVGRVPLVYDPNSAVDEPVHEPVCHEEFPEEPACVSEVGP